MRFFFRAYVHFKSEPSKLVEGKDRAKELVRTKFERGLGKSTMLLVWRMTKLLWVTGKTVIMDSGLYVLK